MRSLWKLTHYLSWSLSPIRYQGLIWYHQQGQTMYLYSGCRHIPTRVRPYFKKWPLSLFIRSVNRRRSIRIKFQLIRQKNRFNQKKKK